ncbi:hypothetical protein C8A01DRAFT_19667, partial [Parachaetomium inaequale]
KMASHILAEISRSELAGLSAPDGRISGLEHLASYNWLNKPAPTISVPVVTGSPPLWSPPSGPVKLTPDSGLVYIDQNAARNPRFPLEPLFRALFTEHPDFNIGDIDLVTDRNNIRKLLRFAQGSSGQRFQIQVEIAGDTTALFTRVEKNTKTFIRHGDFQGYGHNFENAYTKKQSGSTGHHRMVGYDFGGLKCIVRHETDGYVGDKTPNTREEPTDNLSNALRGLSLSNSKAKSDSTTKHPAPPAGAVAVKTGGTTVDVSSTLEIKTRPATRKLKMCEVYPQLWISQTPNLVVGYHQESLFDNVQLRDTAEDLRRWETAKQETLRRLAGLLAKIIAVVKQSSDRTALVEYNGSSSLRILGGKGKRALPDDLYARWEGKGEVDVEQSASADEGDDARLKMKDEEGEVVSG